MFRWLVGVLTGSMESYSSFCISGTSSITQAPSCCSLLCSNSCSSCWCWMRWAHLHNMSTLACKKKSRQGALREYMIRWIGIVVAYLKYCQCWFWHRLSQCQREKNDCVSAPPARTSNRTSSHVPASQPPDLVHVTLWASQNAFARQKEQAQEKRT